MQIAVGASLQHHPSKNPLCIPSSNICKATSLLPLLLVCIGIIIALGYPGGPDPLLLLLKPSIQRMVVSLCGGGWWYMHSILAFAGGWVGLRPVPDHPFPRDPRESFYSSSNNDGAFKLNEWVSQIWNSLRLLVGLK